MSTTWRSDEAPGPSRPLGVRDWLRVVRRGLPLGIVVFGCLGLLLLVRVVERPAFGLRRPITPWITQFVCRAAFVLTGIHRKTRGTPLAGRGAAVSNHASWLDIFALNAGDRIYFVSKAEVANWPGIGWLARATGTVFINRDRKEAKVQQTLLVDRLKAGHRLLFFPEGTSTDGKRVLPFKTTLFQAFFTDGLVDGLEVQPISLVYHAPAGEDPRFYGWWGDMDFADHLLKVLAAPRQGSVEVIYHLPIHVATSGGRKEISATSEAVVRGGLEAALAKPPTA
ncbi:lysophospholipid acyltransferase family protein [Tropicimonas marinistellae]|uniref:lysophospholipid acyltransferase family protein n=1 Tax=Tropicimonas marinistellae TaxID=1739787 RepID=UPI00082F3D5C|nr:lysophospholipid acyltransferase family protein [Tropicimonas marinistellae]